MPALFGFPFTLLTLSMLSVLSGPWLGLPGPAAGDTLRSDLE